MPKGEQVTPVVTDLISKLLVREPSDRLGEDDIEKLLAHPFFNGVNFDTLWDEEAPLDPRLKRLNK